jgi:hypothetical protein
MIARVADYTIDADCRGGLLPISQSGSRTTATASSKAMIVPLISRRSSDRVINDKHHHSADNRDEHAVEVEAGHSGLSEKLK